MPAAISRHWPAPAKLNLFLHVNGRRADGYHELQTLFQFIDYCDMLDFKVTETAELILHSNISNVVADSDNLILRAAKSLQQTTGFSGGAEIWLDKRLPMGGGLGGGSSDAATTLVALNTLWNTQLSTEELAKIGLKLGADIPVFIHGFAAFAEGVGERLQAVNPSEPWYLIIAPDAHVSTAEVFQDPLLPRDTPKLAIDTLMNQPWANDCQKLVVSKYPQVAKALGWLLEYAPSRMTGTGACVFGEFTQKQQALAALAKLPSEMQGFVAQGMNLSPLITRLSHP
ncbi:MULTISPECIES: 4-(cytidine 5'-diphospho)-2-C-methyl-D-erythritol kinase [unclassified Shewanella]|jgi:4-diphosphocytidyl-2-C-methyl-D-erythritol kinase|uniref:4-(cytidine 5'-diphospho)-2-C-methyl-D-erythritol kinase n=1 Tax=Shewanella TaxID=22 RepID=UPI0018E2BBD3|nr:MULTISPECIES: 4-(cytidine 5'-diphospho)-2-C-methyl-D-erythritol kinase [unclassified Shewanella]MBI1673040.1 4-(cytidine 5'-diphospho)-2-C-methyl-D-erythritol kinase [Shewanella sp. DW31]MBP6518447.1 4-(cytidine 5'-diphospho)-2-C-methyl-D-erythritol kinase [Shewanella sp.]MCU8001988.1 4-(cytidine 5'-diphospho)-2-C-methyl-D-erythritol kinase [Shewanella sp. SM96]MCU8038450.1 4-(cytidine 5'-diphospho)-2-C-methyl-D-erythritol kinase [Shewanella sp. SM69]MCU8054989.1 4-(cytidine 5'-diphospho)-2